MKKLEDKIIKKVYRLETKKTTGYLLSGIILIALLTLTSLVFYLVTVEILQEQKSFDLINFFSEDLDVVKKYLIDNVFYFYQELPQPLTLILLICVFLVLVLIVLFIINFKKLKNKLFSLYKFYFFRDKKI